MPRRFELGTIVTRAQELADMENQSNITPTTWKSFFSTQNGLLHGIVADSGLQYFSASVTFSTTTDMDAVGSVTEPNDHLSTILVTRVLPDLTEIPLEEAMTQELPGLLLGNTVAQEARFWMFLDDRLFLLPKPPTNQTYKLRYVPNAADYTAFPDSQVIDVVSPAGEGFILHGMVVRALLKQDKDPRDHERREQMHREEIERWASLRALHSRRRLVTFEQSIMPLDPADWRYGRP